MAEPRGRTNVIEKRECAVCGQPDLYPRCDHREYVDRSYVALDAIVTALKRDGHDPRDSLGYFRAADFIAAQVKRGKL